MANGLSCVEFWNIWLKKTKEGTKYSEEVVESQSLKHYYKKEQAKIQVEYLAGGIAFLCNGAEC